MKRFVILLPWLVVFAAHAQTGADKKRSEFSKYVGKYETNGLVVQVTFHEEALVLVVPGAPLQKLLRLVDHKFKSDSYEDALFVFGEKDGKINLLKSENQGNVIELQKVSDIADKLDATDSLLTLMKSTEHFTFLYGEIDSLSIRQLVIRLEDDYHRILSDFGLKSLPNTKVRVYPNKEAFHRGINFPSAPDEVLATAFGKDDFRMTSPSSVNREDSALLLKMVTHEFTHCVHLNIDYSPNNPRWLWEGVANYEAGYFVNPAEIEVVKNKTFPPLSALNNGLEYELGYVIIEAIKEMWSFDKVVELMRKRGDTLAVFDVAQNDFENKVYQHIYRKYIEQ
jgi:hypothetical protein